MVAKLRGMTQLGMMECKKALTEVGGDIDAAVDYLRKKGDLKAAKKGGAEAKEGVIAYYMQPDSKAALIAEINCQTDFVAKNDAFQAFCGEVAKALAVEPTVDLEAQRVEQVAKMGENIKISRHARLDVDGVGSIAAYIHTGAKIGVLVEVGAGKESTLASDDYRQLVRDTALQVVAQSPLTVKREELDPALIAKEEEIAREQVKNKPPQAIEKIITGKMEKFYQTHCLLEQGFIKNPDVSVREHLAELAKQLDDEVSIRRFVRYQVGEAVGA